MRKKKSSNTIQKKPNRRLNTQLNRSTTLKYIHRRLKDEKEREVQRLREMQEKANDRQAELDALRAKRAMEQNERQAREKERREAEQKVLFLRLMLR